MNPRQIALNIIRDVNINKAYSNISINKHIPNKIKKVDKNLVREIVYGVLENYIYIDYIISKASNIKIGKINPPILDILRISTYQLIFMDRIPHRAAIYEGVELAKKYGHKGSIKFTNGVLRNISKNKEKLMEIRDMDKINHLSIRYSHPRWMVEYFLDNFDWNFTNQLLESNNHKPPFTIRVNSLKIKRNELLEILTSKGYKAEKTTISKYGINIDNPCNLTSMDEFNKGYFTVQDESSMMVSEILNPRDKSLVLDMCAAPGGKATHLAQLMNNTGKILARDIHEHKLKLIDDNSNRLGINTIETEVFDAREIDYSLINKVDYCLIDAPCTGFGIIRRKPDIKIYRKEEDIQDLVFLQRRILDTARSYIKSGGYILYSTCTLGRRENIDNINWFLDKFKDFKLEKINKKDFLEFYPHINNTDGFFIAKLLRINS